MKTETKTLKLVNEKFGFSSVHRIHIRDQGWRGMSKGYLNLWIILSRVLRWKEKQKREKQHNHFCFFFILYFIFKLYSIVLVLPNIEMNPPQVWIKTGILNLNWDFVQFKIAQKRSQRRGKEWVNESGESSPSKSGKIKSPGITVILRKIWASQR